MNPKGLVITVLVVFVAARTAWWFWGRNIELIRGVDVRAPAVSITGVDNLLCVPGQVALFTSPEGDRGAIRFDRLTPDSGADYTVWFAAKDSTHPPVESRGHVFEKYWQTRTGKHEYTVKDMGGDSHIECGPMIITWSSPTWLYMRKGHQFAISTNHFPDFDAPGLKWQVSAGGAY